ncbi:cytochrome c [Oceanobacillus caeni]|uniref:Cytochrome C n=1 Tax=Oceanobacillus caeni TaxID=405946 RepID=A0ABR5MJS8_9BACI|nr:MULTISPECIES: cytochrome c [Bacillaceae]KKE80614.1 cytochrome C [Bacilli bacterium VT-13-104]PZD87818.1 cytochrome c [Bacilli bacterium]KPH75887.1 cytochrome C [Oceanobacillus caeni]MBU8789449.1 cytochrome c [Oceanobacillus caeni]MCR1833861.1 cytochrome c [Oceanobacillus caeni]
MKKNPVIPYAIIAVVGVLAIIIISFIGVNQREAIQQAEEGGEQAVEEGEASTDPEEIFSANCSSCHGADLSGGAGPELTTIGSKYSADEISEIIQNGTDGGMPPFGGSLAPEEIELLSDWLSEKQ